MHTLAALRQGLSVVMIERDAMPTQASVRNFGYHTTIKASPGIFEQRAKRTGEIYRELSQQGALNFHATGGSNSNNHNNPRNLVTLITLITLIVLHLSNSL